MMQAMTIHPGDRIDIEPENVVHDRDGLYEPVLIVERSVSDSQVQDIGQIYAAKKPAKNKINSADQQCVPRPQVSWREIHTYQHVQQNNRIADDIVCFHGGSAGLFKQKLQPLSNNKFKQIESVTYSSATARVL